MCEYHRRVLSGLEVLTLSAVPMEMTGACLAPARSRDACLPVELPAGDYTLLPLTAGLAGATQPGALPAALPAALLSAGAVTAAGMRERRLAVSAHAVGGGGGAVPPQLSMRRRSVTAAEYEALLAEAGYS